MPRGNQEGIHRGHRDDRDYRFEDREGQLGGSTRTRGGQFGGQRSQHRDDHRDPRNDDRYGSSMGRSFGSSRPQGTMYGREDERYRGRIGGRRDEFDGHISRSYAQGEDRRFIDDRFERQDRGAGRRERSDEGRFGPMGGAMGRDRGPARWHRGVDDSRHMQRDDEYPRDRFTQDDDDRAGRTWRGLGDDMDRRAFERSREYNMYSRDRGSYDRGGPERGGYARGGYDRGGYGRGGDDPSYRARDIGRRDDVYFHRDDDFRHDDRDLRSREDRDDIDERRGMYGRDERRGMYGHDDFGTAGDYQARGRYEDDRGRGMYRPMRGRYDGDRRGRGR